MFFQVLTQRLNVKCILGLTATANKSTANEITSHLGLQSVEECVVGTTSIPANLHISVSKDKDRDRVNFIIILFYKFYRMRYFKISCIIFVETKDFRIQSQIHILF